MSVLETLLHDLKEIWSIGINAGSSPYSKNKWKVFLTLLTMKWWCLVAWSGINLTDSQDITMQTPDIIFAVRPLANILKGIQLTLSHICISVLVLYQTWFICKFCYIRNVLLFPTHSMCTWHLILERLSTYSWFQPGSVKFILICKYRCIPLMPVISKVIQDLWWGSCISCPSNMCSPNDILN